MAACAARHVDRHGRVRPVGRYCCVLSAVVDPPCTDTGGAALIELDVTAALGVRVALLVVGSLLIAVAVLIICESLSQRIQSEMYKTLIYHRSDRAARSGMQRQNNAPAAVPPWCWPPTATKFASLLDAS